MVIYADVAALAQMRTFAQDHRIGGFTTNPSLLRKAGIEDYRTFAKTALECVRGKPISFEVLADDAEGMERQAHEIASWGANVYVKIPITNTAGEFQTTLISRLARDNVNLNVTAVMTLDQIVTAAKTLKTGSHILSVFAGRIADTGVDPTFHIRYAKSMSYPCTKVLWASAREAYNVKQAEDAGADIITLTVELINKLELRGKDLKAYSLETVQQFHRDGQGIAF